MRLRPRSVRVRLVCWYAGILAGVILAFALGVYVVVKASLLQQIDRQLERDLRTVARVASDEPNEMNELAQHGSVGLFQVREGREFVAETDGWSRSGLEKAVTGGYPAASWSWTAPTGVPYRLKGSAVTSPGHTYLVLVAQDEQVLRRSLHSLFLVLLFGIPCVLAVALVSGYFLAGRALKPIGLMAAKAREISAERLADRLPIENPDDEFGRLAAVFNETLTRLEDAFERLRRFTADASHELRTPLTALRSVGEVGLQESRDAAACREVIGSMLEETDRLTKLVDCLLTLSRADSGAVMAHREPTDLQALAEEVTECLRVLAEEKRQQFSLECSERVVAMADPLILRQSLLNLVDNALKYTPAYGSIRVTVRRITPSEAAIEVRDSGPGIAKEHHARIFDRFYRLDKGRTRERGGTGLGLAISRWGAEANGGRIELESEEGSGSTFRLVLPVAQNDPIS
ncbi:HAMP domain-containing protein [Geobacter sp. FeAm09]|uniref:sensor histidine kinase n=1 Tax=Geobacter sp. FeAm09 TaxID=2597769 RepID=UPI0011F02B1A|nr:ATP-binding protein [Geobacter sp. FeAm09]QEM67756.1 HAMP domain-containing protein [Geobacter sp. FeAm09]